jgi:hypothetical protein
MPIKKPKPKSQAEIKEQLALVHWKLSSIPQSLCPLCAIDRALYSVLVDSLLWALGHDSKDFSDIMRHLRKQHASQTKHQCAHAE